MLSHGQTTVVIVGHDRNVLVCPIVSHLDGIDSVTILKAIPLRLVGTDSPVEARVERSLRGALCLEQIVKPGRSRKVCPTTAVARSEVTLDSRTLSSILTGVHRCPFVDCALRSVVKELNLKKTLCIILKSRTLTEVIAIIGHQFISAILATDNILQDSECLTILVAHHQSTGIVTSSSTTGGTALSPLTAKVTRGQEHHCLREVFLHLIPDLIVGAVSNIHGLQRLIDAIVCDNHRILIISGEHIVRQAAKEQSLP